MTIQTNTTDRKALVKAIAEELHTEARYLRTPTYAYQIGDFTVDRNGNIIGEDFAPLHDFLLRNGYITEDADVPVETTETEPAEDADAPVEGTEAEPAENITEDADAPVEGTEAEPAEDAAEDADAPVEGTEMESAVHTEDAAEDAGVEKMVAGIEANTAEETAEDAGEMENDTHSEEEQQPDDDTAETAAPADESDTDTQTITIPAPGITVEQLRNLTFILYSRQYLLGLMTGDNTIMIPDALVQSLKDTLPDTPEHFSDFLENYRQFGLQGFDFKDGQFSMTFPFCENEPVRWTTFAGLQGRILQAALAAKRVTPDLIQPEEEAEKYTAHIWLQRMGYKGPEMKEQRNILLHHLHGYCAFCNGAKMQNHKDKYSAIRRERREAERAAAQTVAEASVQATIAPETTMPETTMPTATEGKPSVAAPEKEVAIDE